MQAKTILLFVLSSFGFWLVPAQAQTDSDSNLALLSESEFFVDIPAVATVTRLPTPKAETPASVTIIDSDMIRALGARDFSDLLRLVPGFQVATPRGHRPAATYHGLGDEFTRRMQILIDGRSVYGALFGHVSWATQGIAIEDIDRIEVVRGPNSVTYGANAFLGTINIITRHSAQNPGSSVKMSAGENNIVDLVARHSMRFDRGDLRITAGHRSDDGLDELTDDSEEQIVNLRSDLQLNSKNSLLLQLGLSHSTPEEGSEGSLLSPTTTSTTDAHFEQFRWRHLLDSGGEINLQIYHNYRKLDYNFLTEAIDLGPILGVQQLPVDFDGTATQYEVELSHTTSIGDDWRLVWGAARRHDKVESDAYFADEGSAESDSSRLFGNAEWRANDNVIINLGAMWEDTTITGSSVSPRIAVNYHFLPEHTLRAVWSKARRTPSLFEENGNFRYVFQGLTLDQTFESQGDLDAETMISFELGYLGQFSEVNTSLDLRLYRDRIDDFISIVPQPATDLNDNLAIGYRNEGEITVDGIDLELTYRPSRGNRVVFTLAFMTAAAETVSADQFVDAQIREDSIPDYSGGLLFMHRFDDNWSGSLGYFWVDEMVWFNDPDKIEAYERLDLRLARQFRIGKSRGTAALAIHNAGDEYEDFRSDQFFERRVFFTLGLKL